MGDEITKPIDVFEFDQPNLLLIPLMIESGLFGMRVSTEEEVAFSELGSGKEENFSDVTPLYCSSRSGVVS